MLARDAVKNTDQVARTMLRIYDAFQSLDARALDENFEHSGDLLAFGTDWDEKFEGWRQYKDVHTVQFKALKRFRFQSKELKTNVFGDVAWAADRAHWSIETKDGERVESDVRITSVLRWNPDSKRWLVVQWHVSSGLKERLHEY